MAPKRTRNERAEQGTVAASSSVTTRSQQAQAQQQKQLEEASTMDVSEKKNTEDGQTLAAVDIEGTTMPHGSPADEPAGPAPIVPATLTTDGAAGISGTAAMPLPSIVATNDQQKRKEPNASVASRAAATNAPRMQDDGKTNSPTDSGETDVSAVHASIDSIDTADADAAQALLAAARRIPFANDGDDDTARRGRKSSSAASSANDDAVAGDKAIDTATKLTENMVYRANEEQANDIDSRKQIGGSNDVAEGGDANDVHDRSGLEAIGGAQADTDSEQPKDDGGARNEAIVGAQVDTNNERSNDDGGARKDVPDESKGDGGDGLAHLESTGGEQDDKTKEGFLLSKRMHGTSFGDSASTPSIARIRNDRRIHTTPRLQNVFGRAGQGAVAASSCHPMDQGRASSLSPSESEQSKISRNDDAPKAQRVRTVHEKLVEVSRRNAEKRKAQFRSSMLANSASTNDPASNDVASGDETDESSPPNESNSSKSQEKKKKSKAQTERANDPTPPTIVEAIMGSASAARSSTRIVSMSPNSDSNKTKARKEFQANASRQSHDEDDSDGDNGSETMSAVDLGEGKEEEEDARKENNDDEDEDDDDDDDPDHEEPGSDETIQAPKGKICKCFLYICLLLLVMILM